MVRRCRRCGGTLDDKEGKTCRACREKGGRWGRGEWALVIYDPSGCFVGGHFSRLEVDAGLRYRSFDEGTKMEIWLWGQFLGLYTIENSMGRLMAWSRGDERPRGDGVFLRGAPARKTVPRDTIWFIREMDDGRAAYSLESVVMRARPIAERELGKPVRRVLVPPDSSEEADGIEVVRDRRVPRRHFALGT